MSNQKRQRSLPLYTVPLKKHLPLQMLSKIVITAQAITAVAVCIDATMKVYDNIKSRLDKKKKGKKIGFIQKENHEKF